MASFNPWRGRGGAVASVLRTSTANDARAKQVLDLSATRLRAYLSVGKLSSFDWCLSVGHRSMLQVQFKLYASNNDNNRLYEGWAKLTALAADKPSTSAQL